MTRKGIWNIFREFGTALVLHRKSLKMNTEKWRKIT